MFSVYVRCFRCPHLTLPFSFSPLEFPPPACESAAAVAASGRRRGRELHEPRCVLARCRGPPYWMLTDLRRCMTASFVVKAEAALAERYA